VVGCWNMWLHIVWYVRALCTVAAKWWLAVCFANAVTWARSLADNWQPSFYWTKAGRCFYVPLCSIVWPGKVVTHFCWRKHYCVASELPVFHHCVACVSVKVISQSCWILCVADPELCLCLCTCMTHPCKYLPKK